MTMKVHYKYPGKNMLACHVRWYTKIGGGYTTEDMNMVTCANCLKKISKYMKKED